MREPKGGGVSVMVHVKTRERERERERESCIGRKETPKTKMSGGGGCNMVHRLAFLQSLTASFDAALPYEHHYFL